MWKPFFTSSIVPEDFPESVTLFSNAYKNVIKAAKRTPEHFLRHSNMTGKQIRTQFSAQYFTIVGKCMRESMKIKILLKIKSVLFLLSFQVQPHFSWMIQSF